MLQTNKKCYYIATIIVFCHIVATFCYIIATSKIIFNLLIISDAHFATNATSLFSFQKINFVWEQQKKAVTSR